MYDGKTDQHAVVRRSNLNDQLGCITHVLTDKTGTLTCNNMKFRRCCIHGVDYGDSNITSNATKKIIPSYISYDTIPSWNSFFFFFLIFWNVSFSTIINDDPSCEHN
jgi:magnesium-transporting ATPase (P-type)